MKTCHVCGVDCLYDGAPLDVEHAHGVERIWVCAKHFRPDGWMFTDGVLVNARGNQSVSGLSGDVLSDGVAETHWTLDEFPNTKMPSIK